VIIVKLQGGLGNQMFQYAFGKALAHTRRTPLLVDDSFYHQDTPGVDRREIELELFPAIQLQYANQRLASSFYQYSRWDNRLRNLLGFKKRTALREQGFRYDPSFSLTAGHLLLDGLFQSGNYFATEQKLIADTFRFQAFAPDDPNAAFLRQIQSTRSVSIHVRRGDYVKFASTNAIHGTCSLNYYQNAVDQVLQRFPDAHLFFFSDDPDWVNEHLAKGGAAGTVIAINRGKNSWKDMCLMSHCQHHIIANSSFSWWGAWLNNSKEKMVIAPEKWFRTLDPFFDTTDLLPPGWIKLPNL
jgi:hypothetical protein